MLSLSRITLKIGFIINTDWNNLLPVFLASILTTNVVVVCGDMTSSGGKTVVAHAQDVANRTYRCLPVAHDVLWRRLRMVDLLQQQRYPAGRNPEEDAERRGGGHVDPSPAAITAGDFQPLHSVERREASVDVKVEAKVMSNGTSSTADRSGQGRDQGQRSPRRSVRGRRKMKNRKKQKRKKLTEDVFRKQSWHCGMDKFWKKMDAGLFPAYVQTARCRRQTCMLGLFDCRPRKYRVKLLRRNDGSCSPLPTVGETTAYEETWSFVDYNVVVGCECGRKKTTGSYDRETGAGHRRENKRSRDES